MFVVVLGSYENLRSRSLQEFRLDDACVARVELATAKAAAVEEVLIDGIGNFAEAALAHP